MQAVAEMKTTSRGGGGVDEMVPSYVLVSDSPLNLLSNTSVAGAEAVTPQAVHNNKSANGRYICLKVL